MEAGMDTKERGEAPAEGTKRTEGAESAATQLALQDAEEALALTREERDALRREVAELRAEIRELQHEKHGEKLRADALASSCAKWKASAEAMEEALAAAHAALAKVAVKERTEGASGGKGPDRNVRSPL